MADDAPNESTQDGKQTSGTTSTAGDEFKPITSQEELNRVIGDRVKRAKPADYDDLKSKAARLDEIEQANQSEIEKAQNRVAAAEQKAAQVPALVADALRTHLKGFHSIPDDKAELFLTASEPELLLRQAAALVGDLNEQRRKTANVVTREGTTSEKTADDPRRDFLRQVMGRN